MEETINEMTKKIEKMQMTADGFIAAADYLDQAISKDGFLLGIYGPAYTANLAFGCEVYLKQLQLLTGDVKNGHELKCLYQALNDDIKAMIRSKYENDCQKYCEEINNNAELQNLDLCLKNYNKAFEDWRYWYEGEKSSSYIGWVELRIFAKNLAELVSEMTEQIEDTSQKLH